MRVSTRIHTDVGATAHIAELTSACTLILVIIIMIVISIAVAITTTSLIGTSSCHGNNTYHLKIIITATSIMTLMMRIIIMSSILCANIVIITFMDV